MADEQMDRRTFLNRFARRTAAGALIGGGIGVITDKGPQAQPVQPVQPQQQPPAQGPFFRQDVGKKPPIQPVQPIQGEGEFERLGKRATAGAVVGAVAVNVPTIIAHSDNNPSHDPRLSDPHEVDRIFKEEERQRRERRDQENRDRGNEL